MHSPETAELRFLADAMLLRLARWLRVLGLDTASDGHRSDRAIVERAAAEKRLLLTRDRRLITELRPEKSLLVTADEPLEQRRQVVCAMGIQRPGELFTRCLVCNQPLRARPGEALSKVRPHLLGGVACAADAGGDRASVC